MQTLIFISWCLLFDILCAAARGGATICTDLETYTCAGLMCGVIVTVGDKPFKATSSRNCCRDFYVRTDDEILFIVTSDSLFLKGSLFSKPLFHEWTKDNQLFLFMFEL